MKGCSVDVSDRAFTSGLSIPEFAVSSQMGLAPLAQVMGTCVYQVGWQYAPRQAAYGMGGAIFEEMQTITQAWNEARGAAVSRLADQAREVGGDAVLGVTVRISRYDWAAESVEFVLAGTAVRDPDLRGGPRPVLTDLSLQDYWKLKQADMEPCGLVAGTSCFFIVRGRWAAQMQALTFSQNQEIGEYTEGVYMARETALRRLTDQIQQAGGDGVVGVKITHTIGERELKTGVGGAAVGGLEVTFHAIGTAVRNGDAELPSYPPETAIGLST